MPMLRSAATVLVSLAGFVAAAPTLQSRVPQGVRDQCVHDLSLSYDDGPYYWEKDLSNIFADNGQKTSFFVNGYNYGCIYDQDNVDRLRHAYEAGHLIGSHTWSHVHLPQLSDDEINEQIQLVEDALWKILGVVPAVIRPPYGEIDDRVYGILSGRGYTVVTWSDDTSDALGEDVKEIQDQYTSIALNESKSPRMVLNHEVKETSVFQVAPQAVAELKNAGYKLVTVAECLNVAPYKAYGSYGTRDHSWTCEGKPAPSG